MYKLFFFYLLQIGVISNISLAENTYNFIDLGGKSSQYDIKVAINNTKILNNILNKSSNKRDITIHFPENNTFWFNGGIYGSDISNLTLIVDGSINFIDERSMWPNDTQSNYKLNLENIFSEYSNVGDVKECMMFERIEGFNLYSKVSGKKGIINGNGNKWWGVINYLSYRENRPRLFHIKNSSNINVKNILFKDSPYWTFYADDVINMEVSETDIDARVTENNYHSLKDLTAFNTDGFDVSGKNIYIHDVNIWNQDDCIAVKSLDKTDYRAQCSENMLFTRINASGLGLTIGSIGASLNHSCIRNITFSDSIMPNTFKGIYIKSRPDEGGNRSGEITDITYKNITIVNSTQWPVWIGPQQAIYEGACSLLWPFTPFTKCPVPSNINWSNIVLRDINITNPEYGPGVILGNESNPINNLVFDNVIVKEEKKEFNIWKKNYICNGIKEGKVLGRTNPIPECLDYNILESGNKKNCDVGCYGGRNFLNNIWS